MRGLTSTCVELRFGGKDSLGEGGHLVIRLVIRTGIGAGAGSMGSALGEVEGRRSL